MYLFKPHASKEELIKCKTMLLGQLKYCKNEAYRKKLNIWFDAVQTKLIELGATEVKPEVSTG
jgi:hypothetical protein